MCTLLSEQKQESDVIRLSFSNISALMLPVSGVWTEFGKAIVCCVSVFCELLHGRKRDTHEEQQLPERKQLQPLFISSVFFLNHK